MSTVSVMRARVRDFADVDPSDVSDGFLAQSINYAYQELLGDEPWPFLLARGSLTTVSGTAEYAVSGIAADCEAHRIRRVQYLGYDLVYVTPEQYYTKNPLGATAQTGGSTRFWTVLEAVTLGLWPPPGAAGTARVVYTKVAPALVLDGDPMLSPARYDSTIEAGALAYVYQKIGDFDSATAKQKEFTDGVRDARQDLLSTQRTGPLIYGGQEPTTQLQPPLYGWEG